MKKTIIMLIGILTLCVMLGACDADEEKSNDSRDSTVQTTEPETTDTESTGGETEGAGGISNMYTECEYVFEFYAIESSFTDLIDEESLDEWRTWGGGI